MADISGGDSNYHRFARIKRGTAELFIGQSASVQATSPTR